MTLTLSDVPVRCFQGVIPCGIATADARGIPNITYISQVHRVDDRHVALSCQFFNKTRRNLDENPHARVELLDPLTFQAYRLHMRFVRSEKSGELFDAMAMRIQAIASHTGMSGVFKLIAADICEVVHIEKVEGFLVERNDEPEECVSVAGLRSEIRGLQLVSERINRAEDLESLLTLVLQSLDEYFGFEHTMVLLCDDVKLVTIASRGYGQSGVGAEVAAGAGLIGTVAREKRMLRISGLNEKLRYGRAIRREAGADTPEIPLPGLPDAQSTLIIPLLIGDRLVGVLSAEDRDPFRFGEWDEAYLGVIANQIALGIDRMLDDEPEEVPVIAAPVAPQPASAPASRTLTYYKNDDCVFVDGEYLVRNVPGRILWKLLNEREREGRTEFTNRELRLDASLGLPPIKDNLESRLILLRKRLSEKCPDVRIVPTARGRFALQVDGAVELVEK
ncbi:MAG TPA: GAF domain-containing protein [Thermoanaerobaculia bacterium]|nr:GAF domain-containing protein [Thermoanaerobaculia bacterium]